MANIRNRRRRLEGQSSGGKPSLNFSNPNPPRFSRPYFNFPEEISFVSPIQKKKYDELKRKGVEQGRFCDEEMLAIMGIKDEVKMTAIGWPSFVRFHPEVYPEIV